MPQIHKSVLVAHPAQQMFDLVAEVDRYPEFMPWCSTAEVHERAADGLIASVGIDFRGIRTSFKTRNHHHAPHRIDLLLLEGPFSRLEGHWRFDSLRSDACKVTFQLDYAFKSGLLGQALVPVFDHIARSLVDAFVRRADQGSGA